MGTRIRERTPDATPAVPVVSRMNSGDRIRVLSVVDNMDVGGTELNAVRTAERLDRDRYDLQVACLRADGPLLARYEQAGVPVHVFPLGSLLAPQAHRQGRRLMKMLKTMAIEVVHTHDVYTNIFATPWARWAGVPLVIGSRRWWQDVNRPAHRMLNRWSYRAAHRVLANSPSVGELLVREEGVPRDKLLVIPNFVDDDAFAPMDAVSVTATRDALGISKGELVVGVVANLRPVKDHATLLRAAARLLGGGTWPTVRFVLIGEGPCRTALEAQAESAGIRARVSFAGGRAHQPGVQQLFDIAVLCSTGEGFPNTVVEAMAAGRPVVATRVGGVQDAVLPGETGLLVPPGDDAALATALDSLLRDLGRREAMGRAGRARARTLYNAPSVMSLLQASYDMARATRRP